MNPSLRFLVLPIVATLGVFSLGCAAYRGTARDARPSALAARASWTIVPDFPLVLQEGSKDCGAAALAAVLTYWGKPSTPQQIASAVGHAGERLRAGDMEDYAKKVGMSAFVFYGTMNDLSHEIAKGRPVIVGVGKPYTEKKAVAHYEVVVGVDAARKRVLFLNPGRGWQEDSFEGFAREWAASKGVTLVTFVPETGA